MATVAEGVALRALLPDAAIYLIALTLPADAAAIVAHRLTPFLSTREMGRALADAARAQGVTAQAHLEVDTGIGRAGAALDDAPALLAALDALPGLHITGLATHFARADEDAGDAQAQYAQFAGLLHALGDRADSLLIHADNSPAALRLPAETRHGLIRPGLLLYGIEPAPGMFAGGRPAAAPGAVPAAPASCSAARCPAARPSPTAKPTSSRPAAASTPRSASATATASPAACPAAAMSCCTDAAPRSVAASAWTSSSWT